jgi:hypothetical protein
MIPLHFAITPAPAPPGGGGGAYGLIPAGTVPGP